MTINIHHYHYGGEDETIKDIFKTVLDNQLQIKTILKNQETIMATIKELNAQVDELQTSLDAEQAEIQAAIAKLQETIDTLTANIEAGGTTEERQALVDKLTAIKTDLEATVPTGEGEEEEEKPE